MKSYLRLNTRISLVIVGMIVALVAVLAGLLYVQFGRTMNDTRLSNTRVMTDALLAQAERRGEELALFLADTVANDLYVHRHEAIRDLSRTIVGKEGVATVVVFDSDATVIFDGTSSLDSYGRELSDRLVSRALATGAVVRKIDRETLTVAVPAMVGSRALGGVKIGISLADIRGDIKELEREMARADLMGRERILLVTAVTTLVFIALGIIFSLAVARRISGPIEHLVALTRQIGKGDFDSEMPAPRGREFAELDVALRAMALARREAEAGARQLQAQMAHAGRVAAVGEMATGLAHELNQPLTAISNFVKGSIIRLRNSRGTDPEIIAAMEKAAAEANRAGRIIHSIREFVQKKHTDREPRDLNLIVRETLDLVRTEMGWQGIVLTLDLAPDLPFVLIDLVQIQQVILNLLRNAMDAVGQMPPARRRIHVATSRNSDRIRVAVTDWGEGIGTGVRETLFEPFVTTKVHGLGMGLSICRSIIEAHMGRFEVSGPESARTTFSFSLPPFDAH